MALSRKSYVLGLDLGSNSVGWAAVAVDSGAGLRPTGLIGLGARVFEAGSQGNIASGEEESRNVERRTARLLRRQHERAARRLDFIHLSLQEAGLLPPLPEKLRPVGKDAGLWRDRSRKARAERARLRHEMANRLDAELLNQVADWNRESPIIDGRDAAQRLPYYLRTLALDRQLPPYAVGRALLHLAQRRGYLSNRKAKRDDNTKKGAVESDIELLNRDIGPGKYRTLGELFLHKPGEERIRGRWTARAMYVEEFEAIWSKQREFAPDRFTEPRRKRFRRALFRQRPLASAANLVGDCAWEKGRKRAPACLLSAQRFRYLQQVNHLRVIGEDGEERQLSPEERGTLIERLEARGDMTFAAVRTLLELKKAKLNLERGGEEKLVGNRTSAKLAKIFGEERWRAMPAAERDAVVEEWRRTENDETLRRRGKEAWKLDDEQAGKFAALALEEGYSGLSRQAIAKLLPLLEQGLSYMEAGKAVYGVRPADAIVDRLPPVGSLRNPAVERILTELRKIVNALLRRFGKPVAIRIELARELRKGKKARQAAWKKMRDRERQRQAERTGVLAALGIDNPSRDDIDKVLLWKECGMICPYTDRAISAANLFDGSVEVEHIVPFSISLDNSFLNKTICWREENRKKGNRTPWEAFGHDERLWHEITLRLKNFPGGMFNPKVRRFLSTGHPELEDFASRQLVDTSYAAKMARQYLGRLYGEEAGERIQAGRGGVTHFLRSEWNLNRVLGDGGGKNRDDHRHHAVDALVIAMTDRRAMKLLSEAAVRAPLERRRRFGRLEPPWPGFEREVEEQVARIVVSRRVNRRVSGPLHDATCYGVGPEGIAGGEVRIRKPVYQLKKTDFDDIADKAVREAVIAAWERLPKEDAKLFEQAEHEPHLTAKDGRRIPIRKVRLIRKQSVLAIGEGERRRYAAGNNNHHAEVLQSLDGTEELRWVMVSMFEAYRRRRNGEPVIIRDHGPGWKFLYSIGNGECVELTDDSGDRRIYVCRGTSEGELTFAEQRDARKQDELKKARAQIRIQSPSALARRNVRKVAVSPLGEVRYAND